MKKASKPAVIKKPASKAPAIKQPPKATMRPSLKAKPAKNLVPATPPKLTAKPIDAGQAELAQIVARLARTADKLIEAADRLTASSQKLGSAADTLAEVAPASRPAPGCHGRDNAG